MTTSSSRKSKTDWERIDAKSDDELRVAAEADPDAQPIRPEDEANLRRTPQVKVIRQAMRLSQEEFSAQFRIPIGTLRDWEQGRKEPDSAAKAYLRVIAKAPETVRRALEPA